MKFNANISFCYSSLFENEPSLKKKKKNCPPETCKLEILQQASVQYLSEMSSQKEEKKASNSIFALMCN